MLWGAGVPAVGGDLGSLLLAKAAGKGRQPEWDSQCDQCRFPARRREDGSSGTGSCRCSVPAPTPAQPHGGPRGAGWAACPWLRSPRDITAQARRAAAVGQAGGAGEAPQLRGPGSARGGPSAPRPGWERDGGRGVGGLVCAHPTRRNTRVCTAAFTRACACAACTQAARVHPHSPDQGCRSPSLQMGRSARAPERPPGPRHVLAPQPGHAGARGLPARSQAATAHARARAGCPLCVHTRVQGPEDARGAEGGFGQRCGARGSGVGPGRPRPRPARGWGETFLAALVILSGSKSVPGMFLIPGSVPAPAAPAPVVPHSPPPRLPAAQPHGSTEARHWGGHSTLGGGPLHPAAMPRVHPWVPQTWQMPPKPGGGEAVCSPCTGAGAHPRTGTPLQADAVFPTPARDTLAAHRPPGVWHSRASAVSHQQPASGAAAGCPWRGAGGTGVLRGWGFIPSSDQPHTSAGKKHGEREATMGVPVAWGHGAGRAEQRGTRCRARRWGACVRTGVHACVFAGRGLHARVHELRRGQAALAGVRWAGVQGADVQPPCVPGPGVCPVQRQPGPRLWPALWVCAGAHGCAGRAVGAARRSPAVGVSWRTLRCGGWAGEMGGVGGAPAPTRPHPPAMFGGGGGPWGSPALSCQHPQPPQLRSARHSRSAPLKANICRWMARGRGPAGVFAGCLPCSTGHGLHPGADPGARGGGRAPCPVPGAARPRLGHGHFPWELKHGGGVPGARARSRACTSLRAQPQPTVHPPTPGPPMHAAPCTPLHERPPGRSSRPAQARTRLHGRLPAG